MTTEDIIFVPARQEYLLSILCLGRNDPYGGNFTWRLSTVLNKHAENIVLLGLQQRVEILVSDWGSESPLYTSLELTENARKLVRFLTVTPEVAALNGKDVGFSVSHAINAVARRSRGKFIMSADSDIYIPIETMAKLVYYLELGHFHSFNVRNSFFWASKYQVPHAVVATSPYREQLEDHIAQNWPSYVHDTVTTDNFTGYGVSLLMNRDMWFELTGFNEQINHSRWSDIDFTRRLLFKYRWDDLENHGMKFFHLEHSPLSLSPNEVSTSNEELPPTPHSLEANLTNWGLAEHDLAFVDGYGLALGHSPENHRSSIDPRGSLQSVQDIVADNPRYLSIERRFEFEPHGFFCNAEAVKALLSVLQPVAVCEIGSWMGASARSFAAHPSVEQVVCVDHWDRYRIEKYKPGVHPEHMMNNMYEQFLANAVHSGISGKIYPLRLDSDSAAAYCLEMNKKFDLIYVDGDHTTVGARADILKWLPLLNNRGYMCGDDWTWQKEPDNVAGAVVSVAKEKGFQLFFHGNFWLLIPGEFSIQPLTMEILLGIKPISKGNQPLVSIFCTCKNAEATIRRHIKAVLMAMQQYDNIEYIVQDGVSTDATLSIFEEYREEFGTKLRLISAPDSCCEEGFWLALSRCQGEILYPSLADEEILPDAIPFVVEQFLQNPDVDVIHGDIYNTDIEGNIQCRNPSRDFDLVSHLSHYLPIHLAASFFRKSAFAKAELLPHPNKYGLLKDDFFTWVYLALAVNIKYVPVVFAKYAIHDNALSIRHDMVIKVVTRREEFLENLFLNESLPQEVRINKNLIMGRFYSFAINRLTNANLNDEADKYKALQNKLLSPSS